MNSYHIISSLDNVGTALIDIKKGSKINDSLTAKTDINANFKFALKDIKTGDSVIKYSSAIGVATKDIKAGETVHTHNLKTGLSGALEYSQNFVPQKHAVIETNEFFNGYRRKNGDVGIRNDIYILPTVGCVNSLCESIARNARKISGKDNIFALPHPYGCSQLGNDHIDTQKILSAIAKNGNAGGVLVVSLGCENNHLGEFKKFLDDADSQRIKYLVAQESGDELNVGIDKVLELVKVCSLDKRTKINVKELIIGLKCGGSDALSGITANPLLGLISQRLVNAGGTALLTEVPEMFGAEHLLMDRAIDYSVRNDIIKMINDFKNYYISHGAPVGENPSPGNKDGGITTLEEKSSGCTQKGGNAIVTAVFDYGEIVKKGGLILVNSPGNDIVAQTALMAAGAHLIFFTTGRGTMLGAPIPTIKVSTNTNLYMTKPNWIDFNAGEMVRGASIGETTDNLWDLMLETASGKLTKNEINDNRNISIWRRGVTL